MEQPGESWPEEVTVGREEHRQDSAEMKGRQRRKRARLCSPLQLEVGHSALEEADSQAGVLSHRPVKCLRTEMSADCSGLQPRHHRVTDGDAQQWVKEARRPHDGHLQEKASLACPGFSGSKGRRRHGFNANLPGLPRCFLMAARG